MPQSGRLTVTGILKNHVLVTYGSMHTISWESDYQEISQ